MSGPITSRDQALESLKAKRAFKTVAVSYVIINAFLWIIWAVTGAGYPWPVWVTLGWGIGMAFMAWNTYGSKPITEADVQAEMNRSEGREGPV
ncbi:MAG: 2TM domain-containing protein [Actinomycetia bacterium]|nr:2TM domain-containing protein [Actinomycetes bacterium]